jgi:hypothetical protein
MTSRIVSNNRNVSNSKEASNEGTPTAVRKPASEKSTAAQGTKKLEHQETPTTTGRPETQR